MPKPLYIICSHTASTDQLVGTVSAFHIIESLRFVRGKRPDPKLGELSGSSFFGVAAWRPSPEDKDRTFEYEVLCSSPGKEPIIVQQGTFNFEDAGVQRFYLHFAIEQPWTESGEFAFISRIRVPGENWLSQEYRVPVEVIRA